MESNQVAFTAKCFRGNAALVACYRADCKYPSLMCGDEECGCVRQHSRCEMDVLLSKLKIKFREQGNRTKSLLTQIHGWYENQLKLITIEMEQLKKMMDRLQFKLCGQQQKLYYYLIEGKSDLVIPSLVANVHKMLHDKKNGSQVKISQTKQLLEKQQREVRKILENVRRLVEDKVGKNAESTVPCNFKFHPDLHHPNLTIVDDQTVRVINHVSFGAALIQPSLLASNYTSCEVRLKINRTIESHFFFGVCQLTPNFKITDQYIYNKIQHGSFTFIGEDGIRLGKSEGHRKESSNITKYQTNDQIEIEYWRETERVEVRNTTKGTKSVSFIKSDKNLPLHFAVLLFDEDDQVKIIRAECK